MVSLSLCHVLQIVFHFSNLLSDKWYSPRHVNNEAITSRIGEVERRCSETISPQSNPVQLYILCYRTFTTNASLFLSLNITRRLQMWKKHLTVTPKVRLACQSCVQPEGEFT